MTEETPVVDYDAIAETIQNDPRLRSHFERTQAAWKPMQVTRDGRVAMAADGSANYMREKGKGNVRVMFDHDGRPHRIAKWNKARRKAEKRAKARR